MPSVRPSSRSALPGETDRHGVRGREHHTGERHAHREQIADHLSCSTAGAGSSGHGHASSAPTRRTRTSWPAARHETDPAWVGRQHDPDLPPSQRWSSAAERWSTRRQTGSDPSALLGEAVDVEDTFDGAYGRQHVAEVLGVGHLEGELRLRDAIATRRQRRRQDVDVLVGDDPGDVAQQARAGRAPRPGSPRGTCSCRSAPSAPPPDARAGCGARAG